MSLQARFPYAVSITYVQTNVRDVSNTVFFPDHYAKTYLQTCWGSTNHRGAPHHKGSKL